MTSTGTSTANTFTAADVIGLFNVLDPSQRRRKLYTVNELHQTSDRTLETARAELQSSTREDPNVTERIQAAQRLVRQAEVTNPSFGADPNAVRAHSLGVPVILRG